MLRNLFSFARFGTFLALLAFPGSAQGFTPLRNSSPAVRLTTVVARVEVLDGVASTNLKQTWRNDGGGEAEATWLLPLPEGAVADGLTLTINGVPLAGDVLGADQARGVYEGIVRARRDPALLEYFGRGCLRARIFPIPAHGEAVVEVGFRAVLPERLGLREWSLALRAAGAAGLAPERIVLDLAIHSKKAIKNAYAPLPAIQVIQKDDHEVRASFEGGAAQLAGSDLTVFYGLSEAEFGLDLLTHRAAGAPEGTFLMLISPKREWQAQETLKKSIAFVLDTSGSMEGPKIAQAKAALKLFLQSLGPDDRFDVVPFATEAEPFFGARVPASAEKIAEAMGRVERIAAAGGTNIQGALEVALREESADGRVPIVVFLTDGEPTVGVTVPEEIRKGVLARNARHERLFVFGVGDSVNTQLLDSLAAENGGARDYVRENERIDEKTRALFAKLAHPVMSDLTLSIDGLAPTKCVPAKLPDLFAGDRLEYFGRYDGEGAHAIRLAGVVGGVRREYVYEGTFARETSGELAFLGALWAERRVGVLLDAIRLNGSNPELVGEVERLGREYRIVTPYTSHLVVEPGLRRYAGPSDTVPPGGAGGRPTTGAAGPATGPAGPTSPGGFGPATPGAGAPGAPGAAGGRSWASNETGTGADGFFLGSGGRAERTRSLEELAHELSLQGVLPSGAPEAELVALARQVSEELQSSERALKSLGDATTGAKAVDDSVYLERLISGRKDGAQGSLFELFTRRVQDKTFVLRSGVWTDAGAPEPLPAAHRVVEAFSPEYFALLAARPALAPYFALSTRLVVVLGGEVFEVRAPPPPPSGG